MIYTGGFFEGVSFSEAFANSDASVGLVFGSVVTLILTIFFYIVTKALSFKECMDSIPEGFKSMVPAILILVFAWTLKSMTNSLGSDVYVAGIVNGFAENNAIMSMIPAIVFLIVLLFIRRACSFCYVFVLSLFFKIFNRYSEWPTNFILRVVDLQGIHSCLVNVSRSHGSPGIFSAQTVKEIGK